jgi:hypothetical protein
MDSSSERIMRPWLMRCWSWFADTFFSDLDKTQVVECQSSVLDRTEITWSVRVGDAGPRCAAPLRHDEKRIAVRYPCDRNVRCSVKGRAGSLRGRCRNVSRGGIGLVAAFKVEAGTALIVELHSRSSSKASCTTIPVRVVHVRPMPIRGWFLGCSFAEDLTDAEIRALI